MKKINFMSPYDSSNPEQQTDFVFVQGRGVELQKGKVENVRQVYVDVLQECQSKQINFVKDNLNISGIVQEYNSI